MDEKVRGPGQIIMAMIYLSLVFPMGGLGIGMLASYPDWIWQVGILATGSSILFLYSGITTLRAIRKREKTNAKLAVQLQQAAVKHSQAVAAQTSSAGPEGLFPESKPEALAVWEFSRAQWDSFRAQEKKAKLNETILLVVVFTVLCGWGIQSAEGESWSFALAFSFSFACLIFVTKYFLSRKFTDVAGNRIQVIVSRTHISINGKLFAFSDQERSFNKVELLKKNGVDMLEIHYSWSTRKGRTGDELYVPVPADRLDEARAVMEALSKPGY